jgi:putative glutamine amidotransferase
MKPIIGITGDVDIAIGNERNGGGRVQLNFNYLDAIADAGGCPIILPPQADPVILQSLAGLVIPGGNDIDAAEFGEANHPTVEPIAPPRYHAERALLNAIDPKMPVLGICYGCQLINVAMGGTMIQHVPDVVGHELDKVGTLQSYDVEPTSKLGEIAGTKQSGQSWHHQTIKEIGRELKITARNEDGLVEAIESTSRPWLIGVQWHPERTPDREDSRKLFTAFIEAAIAYRESVSEDHEFFNRLVVKGMSAPTAQREKSVDELFKLYKDRYGF